MSKTETAEPSERIGRLVQDVGLSQDFADFAESVYDAVDNDGGYAEAGVPAVVYAAVRIKGKPVKPNEIADASGVDRNRLMKDMRRMVSELPFDVSVDGVGRRYVDRYVGELGGEDTFGDTAMTLCENATEAGLHIGRAPSSFAAAVVYAATVVEHADVEQKRVAEVADVTTTIIRRYYREIIDVSDEDNHDDFEAIVDRIIQAIDGNVPETVRDEAFDMANAIDHDADFVRRCKPESVAAGIVYVAARRNRLDVTQAECGDPVGMSRHAVNARSQAIKRWDNRRRIEAFPYNRLKELAAEHGIDVGMTPEREYLIDRLAENGVSE